MLIAIAFKVGRSGVRYLDKLSHVSSHFPLHVQSEYNRVVHRALEPHRYTSKHVGIRRKLLAVTTCLETDSALTWN